MIINTKTGILVTGTLARDAEYKTVGQKNTPLLKFGVLYGHEETPGCGRAHAGQVFGRQRLGRRSRVHAGAAAQGRRCSGRR